MEEKPAIVKKWSWGAAMFHIIYGFGNRVYLGTLIFVGLIILYGVGVWYEAEQMKEQMKAQAGAISPYSFFVVYAFGLLLCVGIPSIFGIKGHAWAWKHRNYPAEHFESVQKTWDRAGLALFLFLIISWVASMVMVYLHFGYIPLTSH